MEFKELEKIRIKRGMLKKDFAQILGVSRMSYNNWERAGTVPERSIENVELALGLKSKKKPKDYAMYSAEVIRLNLYAYHISIKNAAKAWDMTEDELRNKFVRKDSFYRYKERINKTLSTLILPCRYNKETGQYEFIKDMETVCWGAGDYLPVK